MTANLIHTTIEILGKFYPVRCPESELKSLQQAAEYLNQKMQETKEVSKTVVLERIAIITALNLAYQFLQLDQQKSSLLNKLNQRMVHLQDKLDIAINKNQQTELIDLFVE